MGMGIDGMRSCDNCKHFSAYSYSGTLLEPPDSGWECGSPDYAAQNHFWVMGDGLEGTDREIVRAIARDCPGYEYFDWAEHEKEEAEGMAQLEESINSLPNYEPYP